MSEPKLISPMLDHFVMGDAISDHNGVRCCPAMEKDTDNKYIVKIISTPATQTQLDALLLSGAYSNTDAALSYFKELSDGIVEEAKTLQRLSQLEGFLPYENWQVEPMDDGIGFDVYLLSTYRNTLQHYFRKNSMTHLGAINLGLDLCAALSVCRKIGYLYVDLKPNNVYMTTDQVFRIGDIGFLRLDSLKYASLPDRYRSQYTAPEITDAFSALNTTIDVYAVGLILYQAFNDGVLPFKENPASGTEFPPPAYADYEMAEIILKACAQDPDARWQDPMEMGQALVSYMQRNGANNTPIVPVPETQSAETSVEKTDECSEVTEVGNLPETDTSEAEITADVVDCEISEDIEPSEDTIYTEDEHGNLTFLEDADSDETLPGEDTILIDYKEVTDEVSDMLAQADELIAHETPEPVVQPEPIDVPVPAPLAPQSESFSEDAPEDESEAPVDEVIQEEAPEDECEDTQEEQLDETDDSEIELKEADDNIEAEDCEEQEPAPKKSRPWIRNTLLIILSLLVIAAGIFFYKSYYLQPIEAIVLEGGDPNTLTVLVTSDVDESKLSVVCADIYGNQHTEPVVNGRATFTGLAPNSAYTIEVVINGFHRLTGDTFTAYTTPMQTNIVQFTAVTGSEDGSVILAFAVEGHDAEQWKIRYQDDNQQTQEVLFSGHVVTLNNLTVGNDYTFSLEPIDDISITGTNEITHTASKIIKPEKVVITGLNNNTLSAAWFAPEDTTVESWTVRCYDDNGFDETIVTGETSVSFTIKDTTTNYTVEVSAAGMSVTERAYAPANSTSVENFNTVKTSENILTITWDSVNNAPQNGWVLLYTADDSAPQEITCDSGNKTVISPVVPGCKYTFTLQTADGSAVLGGYSEYASEDASKFEGYGVTADNMEFMMCKTPSFKGWDRYDLSRSDYRTEFSVGENASFLIRMHREYDTSSDEIITLFVIRDSSGKIVSTPSVSSSWTDMWYRNYCELDIPGIPQTPGNYTISVYFNGYLVNENPFYVVSE